MREGQADIGLMYVECSVQIRLVVDMQQMPISSDSWGNHLLEYGGNHYELVAVTMGMFPGK